MLIFLLIAVQHKIFHLPRVVLIISLLYIKKVFGNVCFERIHKLILKSRYLIGQGTVNFVHYSIVQSRALIYDTVVSFSKTIVGSGEVFGVPSWPSTVYNMKHFNYSCRGYFHVHFVHKTEARFCY